MRMGHYGGTSGDVQKDENRPTLAAIKLRTRSRACAPLGAGDFLPRPAFDSTLHRCAVYFVRDHNPCEICIARGGTPDSSCYAAGLCKRFLQIFPNWK